MSITLTSSSISSNEINNAFNNAIIYFSTNSGSSSTKAVISLEGSSVFEITGVSNNYEFNLKEFNRFIFEALNFRDNNEFNPTPSSGDLNYLYNDSDIVKDISLNISIRFASVSPETYSTNYTFFRSVEQVDGFSAYLKTAFVVMSGENLTAFKGYPFDIPFYAPSSEQVIDVINSTNDQSLQITKPAGQIGGRLNLPTDSISQVVRRAKHLTGAFVIDDLCNIDYNNGFLDDGYNQLSIGYSDMVNINVNLKVQKNGIYLKWVNENGAWSYWLFDSIYREVLSSENRGNFIPIQKNLIYTTETVLSKGKNSVKVYSISALALNENNRNQLEDILTSPRVELYNGSYMTYDDSWQTVSVRTGTFETENTKRNLVNLRMEIEFNNYTQ